MRTRVLRQIGTAEVGYAYQTIMVARIVAEKYLILQFHMPTKGAEVSFAK